MTIRAMLAFAAAVFALPAPCPSQSCGFRVLVFSKTQGFRHGSQIRAGISLIRSLGTANGFAVDTTEDAGRFTPGNLAQYAAVVFLNTTGNVLNATQEKAFEAYVGRGGGYVGVHAAADCEYGWPFYGRLVGAWFSNHPAIQPARLDVVDRRHESTAHMPASFSHTDEWYNFRTNPAKDPKIRVLLTIDERTYRGGNMGTPHPIAWYQANPGVGRSWYTAFGHTVQTYSAEFFKKHLLGGILFVSRGVRATRITSSNSYGKGTGSPILNLATRITTSQVTLELAAGRPRASGLFFISTCNAAVSFGPLTLLVDLQPGRFLAGLPITFDGAGRARLALPTQLSVPAFFGTSLFAQGAQVMPTIGLSPGVQLVLTQ